MDGTVNGDRASVGPRGNDAPGASETKPNPVLSNGTWSPITSPPGRLNVQSRLEVNLNREVLLAVFVNVVDEMTSNSTSVMSTDSKVPSAGSNLGR